MLIEGCLSTNAVCMPGDYRKKSLTQYTCACREGPVWAGKGDSGTVCRQLQVEDRNNIILRNIQFLERVLTVLWLEQGKSEQDLLLF